MWQSNTPPSEWHRSLGPRLCTSNDLSDDQRHVVAKHMTHHVREYLSKDGFQCHLCLPDCCPLITTETKAPVIKYFKTHSLIARRPFDLWKIEIKHPNWRDLQSEYDNLISRENLLNIHKAVSFRKGSKQEVPLFKCKLNYPYFFCYRFWGFWHKAEGSFRNGYLCF